MVHSIKDMQLNLVLRWQKAHTGGFTEDAVGINEAAKLASDIKEIDREHTGMQVRLFLGRGLGLRVLEVCGVGFRVWHNNTEDALGICEAATTANDVKQDDGEHIILHRSHVRG